MLQYESHVKNSDLSVSSWEIDETEYDREWYTSIFRISIRPKLNDI